MGGTLRSFWPHILSVVVVLWLWDTPVVKPFRVFMVMIHELCHGAAAIATGGEVVEVRTHWGESGRTLTRGGIFPVISSAGYVGSAFLGALVIYAGSWGFLQRVILGGVGCVSLGMTLMYTPVMGVDFAVGSTSGVLLLMVAARSARLTRWIAAWLGVMLCLYSLYDFRTDLWMQPEQTDAGILARHWGFTVLTYPIAFVWVALSVTAMLLAMRSVVRRGMKRAGETQDQKTETQPPMNPGLPPAGAGTYEHG